MTYNTGNPIGSNDPRDLADNAQALDRALNDTALTFTDRMGNERMTFAGLEQAATGVPAVAASIAAQAAQAGSESARDAALLSRGVFETTAKALSKGVSGIASLVGGSGGTNGTFDLAFSGGAGSGAAGRFVVAGGAVVSVTITSAGDSYTSAPAVSFAASSGLTGASATAVIAVNCDVAEYFSTPVTGSNDLLVLYRVDAGPVATEIGRYPSADAALKPIWAGKKNGWLDTFFRHSVIGESTSGKSRWRGHSGGLNYTGASIAAGSVFDGNVLRKTGPGNQCGPLLWLSDIGAAPGDTITIYALLTGSDGHDGYMLGDCYTAANAQSGSAIAGGNWSAVRDSGASGLILSSTPQRIRATFIVPAGADVVHVRFYSASAEAEATTDVHALWAFKGEQSAGPGWPIYADDAYAIARVTQSDAAISAAAAAIVSVADDVAVLQTRTAPGGLRDLKAALCNPFYQHVGIVLIGDSITWGMSATGIAEITPRTGALTDARNNGSSPSWANLLHKYIGLEYYEDAAATESAWDGTPSGVAKFEYSKAESLFPGSAPFERTNTNSVTPGAWTTTVNSATRHGYYIQAAVNSSQDNLRVKWTMTGYEFDVVFAAQSNGARYQLIVDNVVLGTYSTQTGDTGLPVSFGNVRTHGLGGFKRGAVVELKVVPGDVSRTNLRLEAVVINRKLRVTNQGVIGTTAARYHVDGMDEAALQEGDSFALVQLGTNDRAVAWSYGVPEGPLTLLKYMGLLCDTLAAAGIEPIIMCANAVVDNSPPTYKFDMATVRATLRGFAMDRQYDFIDHFADTRPLIAAGDTSGLADGLHPNDSGHALMFGNIKRRIDAA